MRAQFLAVGFAIAFAGDHGRGEQLCVHVLGRNPFGKEFAFGQRPVAVQHGETVGRKMTRNIEEYLAGQFITAQAAVQEQMGRGLWRPGHKGRLADDEIELFSGDRREQTSLTKLNVRETIDRGVHARQFDGMRIEVRPDAAAQQERKRARAAAEIEDAAVRCELLRGLV